MVYTPSNSPPLVRVITLRVNSCSSITEVFRYVEVQTIMSTFLRKEISDLFNPLIQSTLETIKSNLSTKCNKIEFLFS